MRYPRQIIAHLRNGAEQRFNLRHYDLNQLAVKMGGLVLGLSQNELDLPGVAVVPLALGVLDPEAMHLSTSIKPGSRLLVGRASGVEIAKADGSHDHQSMSDLGGDSLTDVLRTIDDLSRDHARIEVVDAWTLQVKDKYSVNGTMLLGNPVRPEYLRRQMRVVR